MLHKIKIAIASRNVYKAKLAYLKNPTLAAYTYYCRTLSIEYHVKNPKALLSAL